MANADQSIWRDDAEIARFNALARRWWDPDGPMKPLHRLNPARLGFIRSEALKLFDRSPRQSQPFVGLSALDIGCGAGLVTEPLARMGFTVTGIDPATENISVAREHAEQSGLTIDYRASTIESLPEQEQFDLITLLEVVEHVPDIPALLAAAARHLKPGGMLIGSTLNRTFKSYALAIIGAEYILRWLPKGTHDHAKFVTPEEFESHLAQVGLEPGICRGMVFNPLTGQWLLSDDMDVNYLITARVALR
jgi:2-polyprenyl-6-hydroxyphenyl methylase/3-demethylubiquinone-9 3-methyltransferase